MYYGVSYDSAGNPLTYFDKTLAWKQDRCLASVTGGITANYTYDANGLRQTKTVGGAPPTDFGWVGDRPHYIEAYGSHDIQFIYDGDGQLVYAGKVGTGFDERTLREVHDALLRLAIEESPFAERVPERRGVHWARPELVAEVAFTEWTADGRLRHPAFHGLRNDKDARSVVRERRD